MFMRWNESLRFTPRSALQPSHSIGGRGLRYRLHAKQGAGKCSSAVLTQGKFLPSGHCPRQEKTTEAVYLPSGFPEGRRQSMDPASRDEIAPRPALVKGWPSCRSPSAVFPSTPAETSPAVAPLRPAGRLRRDCRKDARPIPMQFEFDAFQESRMKSLNEAFLSLLPDPRAQRVKPMR